MTKKSVHLAMIDMDVMQNVFGNNHPAIAKYLQEFVGITTQWLDDVGCVIQEKNATAAQEYFHKMKGSIGSIGFKKMYKLCEQAEEKLSQLDWIGVSQAHHEMEITLKKFQAALKKEL